MLAETLKDIFEETGLDYDVRCLITRYRTGQTVSREVRKAADELFGDFCFATVIRECADVEKSIGSQTPLQVWAPQSPAAQDYRALTDELLESLGNKVPRAVSADTTPPAREASAPVAPVAGAVELAGPAGAGAGHDA